MMLLVGSRFVLFGKNCPATIDATMERQKTSEIIATGWNRFWRHLDGILPPKAKYVKSGTHGPQRTLVKIISRASPKRKSSPKKAQLATAPMIITTRSTWSGTGLDSLDDFDALMISLEFLLSMKKFYASSSCKSSRDM